MKDHPRLCGEKVNISIPQVLPEGSPPPMRGKELVTYRNGRTTRITPAYAGKSYNAVADTYHPQDHPRLCGEKVELLETLEFPVGSPPPMRGKAVEFRGCDNLVGITPAYAGKSITCFWNLIAVEDHPRLCGEKAV